MSRIGKQPIEIKEGIDIKVDDGFVVVKGPKGELKQEIHPDVSVEVKDGQVIISVNNENEKSQRSLWGLFASLVNNMVVGVTDGFSKQLEIKGVGFKASVSGSNLILNVGFSHQVEYNIPKGIDIKVEGNTITVSGIDKQLVGEVAAQIRKIKKPEPYKGTGIRYIDEHIIRKVGKAAAK